MSVITYEGIVEDGRIHLPDHIRLPERARVFVVIPDLSARVQAWVVSPRLADPERIVDFTMEVREGDENALL